MKGITDACDLFDILEQSGKISEDNLTFLINIMKNLKRLDLRKQLLDMQAGPGSTFDLPAVNQQLPSSHIMSQGNLKTPGDFTQTSPPADKQVPKTGTFTRISIKTKPARSLSEELAHSRGAYNVDDARTTQGGQSMHLSKSFSGSPSLLDQPISEKDSHDPLHPTDRQPLSYKEMSSFLSESTGGQAAGFGQNNRNKFTGMMRNLSLQDPVKQSRDAGISGGVEDDLQTDSAHSLQERSRLSSPQGIYSSPGPQSDQPDGSSSLRCDNVPESLLGMQQKRAEQASFNGHKNEKITVMDKHDGTKRTISLTPFKKGDQLLHFAGDDLVTYKEAIHQQKTDPESEAKFLFFKHEENSLCFKISDGPCKFIKPARSNEANTELKVDTDEGTPKLSFVARKDIESGEELKCSFVQMHQKVLNSTWADKLLELDKMQICKQVGRLYFSKSIKIAKGSYGCFVYLGLLDGHLPVAVKRISSEIVSKEIDIHQKLKDKNLKHVLKTLCVEEDEEFIYLITELCERNLEMFIEERKTRIQQDGRSREWESDRYRICVEFMKGLKELHDLNILHRDIKPANVLFDNNGKVVIGDFGISRNMSDNTTLYTESCGTMCWMSVESLKNDAHVKYKKSSDVQVAGILLYYILSDGHIPHESTSPYKNQSDEATRNMKAGKFTFDHLVGNFMSLRPLLEKMLSLEQQCRPSIEECLQQFQDLSSGVEDDLQTDSAHSLQEGSRLSSPQGQRSSPQQGQRLSSPQQGQRLSSPQQGQRLSSPQQGQRLFSPQQDQRLSSPQQDQRLSSPQQDKARGAWDFLPENLETDSPIRHNREERHQDVSLDELTRNTDRLTEHSQKKGKENVMFRLPTKQVL